MSDVRDPERDQQLPFPNEGPSCHDLVLGDLRVRFPNHDAILFLELDLDERKEHGLKKYDSLLQPHNGRSFTLDVFEEALDLAAYTRGKIEELIDELEIEVDGPARLEKWQEHYGHMLSALKFIREELEEEREQSNGRKSS